MPTSPLPKERDVKTPDHKWPKVPSLVDFDTTLSRESHEVFAWVDALLDTMSWDDGFLQGQHGLHEAIQYSDVLTWGSIADEKPSWPCRYTYSISVLAREKSPQWTPFTLKYFAIAFLLQRTSLSIPSILCCICFIVKLVNQEYLYRRSMLYIPMRQWAVSWLWDQYLVAATSTIIQHAQATMKWTVRWRPKAIWFDINIPKKDNVKRCMGCLVDKEKEYTSWILYKRENSTLHVYF